MQCPLGGYVKMVGEEVGEEVDPALERISFAHKPVGKRFLIVFAGPSSNLFWAFVIFSITFFSFGAPRRSTHRRLAAYKLDGQRKRPD